MCSGLRMKRFHAVRKDDYAKWVLDYRRINFAIAQRGEAPGVNHWGSQVASAGGAYTEIVTKSARSCCA